LTLATETNPEIILFDYTLPQLLSLCVQTWLLLAVWYSITHAQDKSQLLGIFTVLSVVCTLLFFHEYEYSSFLSR